MTPFRSGQALLSKVDGAPRDEGLWWETQRGRRARQAAGRATDPVSERETGKTDRKANCSAKVEMRWTWLEGVCSSGGESGC